MNPKVHPKIRWNSLAAPRMAQSMGLTPLQMSHIHFGYIAPINYLSAIPLHSKFHLCLAHLCESDVYCRYYRERSEADDLIFMDNSAFELGEGIEAERLLDLIDNSGINPDVIVAPDYPGQHFSKTLKSLEKFITAVQDRKYSQPVGIMGVPQSEVGEHNQWLSCYKEMTTQYNVDVVGMSILALPNAFCKLTGTKDISHNRIYGSLFLKRIGNYSQFTWHHYLGAGSPSEIQLIPQLQMADSMDSSSPIWHGINHIAYDDSPTGLAGGKIKRHVVFDLSAPIEPEIAESMARCIVHNIEYVEQAISI